MQYLLIRIPTSDDSDLALYYREAYNGYEYDREKAHRYRKDEADYFSFIHPGWLGGAIIEEVEE